MNTFAKLTLASALMLSAAMGVASAQQADNDQPQGGEERLDMDMGGGHGKGHHRGGHGGKHGVRMIDANNDGVIGDDEAAGMADHAFMRMDEDNDGKLTETEFSAGPRGKHGGWFNWSQAETDAVLKVRKDKFATLDANKDQSLDKPEFFADAKAQLAAADTDKDGKVTPWEFRAAR